ncbi:MAG: ImmA/IrrE family metallo-endopeptidase [Oscillospiraceae bacterium]|nr:ImmA/IrrE family metallo-endopeptidase [Oscillospiraceae bacterium]
MCRSLVKRCKTRDPFELADILGVHVEFDNLRRLKGYYSYMNRIRLIVISENLDSPMQALVCAHELGHDRLHFKLACRSPLRDEGFSSSGKTEIEANRFAANILVSDEDYLEYAELGYTSRQIASALCVCPEIVLIKERILTSDGIQLRIADMPRSDFLKRMD